ncbi:hypothetical protein HAX54_012800 [Datura stramonium]|uniref:Uncharacterized protein n=1 Tax=Datura stramonium TaxID=4076 RepID=A0ABS8TKB1_DATST|nr:hypothetical protein [Datura stramonium]
MSPGRGEVTEVARSKKAGDIKNTWKMITEGRHITLTRHMKKSDTFHTRGRHVAVDDALEENENSTTFHPPQQQHQHHQSTCLSRNVRTGQATTRRLRRR